MPARGSRFEEDGGRALPAIVWLIPFVPVAAFLIWATRGQTFYADEWFFFVHAAGSTPRRLLEPDQGNLVFGAVLVYKATLSIAGAGDHLGLRIVWVALDLICAGLFFALLRSRVGNFAAAVPALVLTLFGASWEMFGGPLGINVLTSVAFGLGALLALERRGATADAAACALLLASVFSHSTGLAFAAWTAAVILARDDRRQRIWVVVLPLVLYAAWTIWARQFGQSEITLQTLASAPAAVVSLLASSASSMFGAFRYPGPQEAAVMDLVTSVNEEPGLLLGGLLIVAIALRLRRFPADWRFAPPLAALAVYWASIALVSPARDPATGRYQYASAIFILLLLGELWRGWRPRRGTAQGIVAIGVVAIVPNAINLQYSAKFMRTVSEQDRAKLAVVEALRDRIPSNKLLQPPPINIESDLAIGAGDYFDAVDAFGSPAMSLAELPQAGSVPRVQADRELLDLLEIAPASAAVQSRRDGCRALQPGTPAAATFQPPAGGSTFTVAPGSEAVIGLRRYGDEFIDFEPLAAGAYELRLPDDGIPQPWLASVESATPVRECPLR
jgi:hypothetical protein